MLSEGKSDTSFLWVYDAGSHRTGSFRFWSAIARKTIKECQTKWCLTTADEKLVKEFLKLHDLILRRLGHRSNGLISELIFQAFGTQSFLCRTWSQGRSSQKFFKFPMHRSGSMPSLFFLNCFPAYHLSCYLGLVVLWYYFKTCTHNPTLTTATRVKPRTCNVSHCSQCSPLPS